MFPKLSSMPFSLLNAFSRLQRWAEKSGFPLSRQVFSAAAAAIAKVAGEELRP